MTQKYEGPIQLEQGELTFGTECSGRYQLYNMETGRLHISGTWSGIYDGEYESGPQGGMLYYAFADGTVNGKEAPLQGFPAYRFQGVRAAR